MNITVNEDTWLAEGETAFSANTYDIDIDEKLQITKNYQM